MPRGYLTPQQLRKILTKADSETILCGVHLFNWTEPFLNNQIGDLIRVVNEFDTQCYLSTNLNRGTHIVNVCEAGPWSIRISCSGYTQKVYEIGHKGGNVEVVKKNMRLLSAARRAWTKVHLLWHRYPHNEHELPLMKQFCEMLGFKFIPVEAYWMPLEKVLDYWEGSNDGPNVKLHTSLETHKSLVAGRTEECRLQTQEITLDANGDVQLCCGVFDPNRFNLGNYLGQTLAEIQAKRFSHNFCDRCIKAGGHIYVTGHSFGPESKLRKAAKKIFRNTAWMIPQPLASQIAATT
jgi:hypothetical protein